MRCSRRRITRSRSADKSMKGLSRFTALFAIFVFLNGCTINTTTHCFLKGDCAVTQPDHIVKINADGCESFFNLTFVGKEKTLSLNSVAGSYQYKSKPVQSLQLIRLNKDSAMFSPSDADMFIGKSPDNVVQSRVMNHGQYNLNFEYVLNGQTNSCDFDVKYVSKTEWHFVPFWAWFAYANAYKNYGHGP